MDEFNNLASRLEDAVEKTSILATESRMKFDAMIEMQSEERLKMQEMFLKEKQDLLEHFEKSDKRKNKIIIGLIIALAILIGSGVCGAIYVLAKFDMAVVSTQDLDNNSILYDGININTTD